MLLGKAPEGFTFEPKHKSNSYAAESEELIAGIPVVKRL